MKIFLILITSFFIKTTPHSGIVSKSPGVERDASNYAISGKVIEETSGESLAGVEIEILERGISVYTNMDGEFQIDGLDDNIKYSFRISYISYKSKIIRGLNPSGDNLIIKLQGQSLNPPTIISSLNPGT